MRELPECSQKSSKTKECQCQGTHPQTLVMIQIRTSSKMVSTKHRIFTHFPKDRNCEVCKRTKITRAPCRRRTGEAVLWAENFGDMITADHKVLSDNCESRNNHRYAVVQDLATQWAQSYPCKTKTSQETEKSSRKFPNRQNSRKSFVLTIHWI